jgi:hypothetical protein
MPTLADFLSVPEVDRDVPWLQGAVQTAIQLELSTLPPYLTAMWSVRDQDHPVADALDGIVRLTSLSGAGGTVVAPQIARSDVVPKYPGPLPGNIEPSLVVGLERLSRSLVHEVFMAIEKPEYAPISYAADGTPYPTIGAFYDAIADALLQLNPDQVVRRRQRTAVQVGLTAIGSQIDALRAVSLIKKQGEGTATGPYFDPTSAKSVAHYYRFGEIYHEHRIKIVNWQVVYTGDPLRFPSEDCIYPMAPVPAGGYDTADAKLFNRTYSNMLRALEGAWATDDDTEGQACLAKAVTAMNGLSDVAARLMCTPIAPPDPATYGPGFVYCP